MAAPTPTGTTLQIATDDTFNNVVYSGSSTDYRTSEVIKGGDLPYGQMLYARVKHATNSQDTAWSDPTWFRIGSLPPAQGGVIGVCCNSEAPFWSWIDEQGNQVDEFDYQSYPTYANAKMVTMDADRAPVTMTAIPKFYIKTAASGPAGSYAEGKKCWWISPNPWFGFRPHPAFKRSPDGTISDWCYLGTYLGCLEYIDSVECIGSVMDNIPTNSGSFIHLQRYCDSRNDYDTGNVGYRAFDIWDLSLLRILTLLAKRDPDTYTSWGPGGNGISVYPKCGSTQAKIVFKGTQEDPEVWVDDLWGCFNCYVDRTRYPAGVIYVSSPMDREMELVYNTDDATRYTTIYRDSGRYIFDILDCPITIGSDTHDLMELFLPKSGTDDETLSPYSIRFAATADNNSVITFGAGAKEAERSSIGLFYNSRFPPDLRNLYHSIRIAKN